MPVERDSDARHSEVTVIEAMFETPMQGWRVIPAREPVGSRSFAWEYLGMALSVYHHLNKTDPWGSQPESYVGSTTIVRVTANFTIDYAVGPDGLAVANVTVSGFSPVVNYSVLEQGYSYYGAQRNDFLQAGRALPVSNCTFVVPSDPDNRSYFVVRLNPRLVSNGRLRNTLWDGFDYREFLVAEVWWVNGSKVYGPIRHYAKFSFTYGTFARGAPARLTLLEQAALRAALGRDPGVTVVDFDSLGWKRMKLANGTEVYAELKMYPNGHPNATMILVYFRRGRIGPNQLPTPFSEDLEGDEWIDVAWLELRAPEHDPVARPAVFGFTGTVVFSRGRFAGVVLTSDMDGGDFIHIAKMPWRATVLGADPDGGYRVRLSRNATLGSAPCYVREANIAVVAPDGWEPVLHAVNYSSFDYYIMAPIGRVGNVYLYRVPSGLTLMVALESKLNSTVISKARYSAVKVCPVELATALALGGGEETARYLRAANVGRETASGACNGTFVTVAFAEPVPEWENTTTTDVFGRVRRYERVFRSWRAEVEVTSTDGSRVPPLGWWWVVAPSPAISLVDVQKPETWIGLPGDRVCGSLAWARYPPAWPGESAPIPEFLGSLGYGPLEDDVPRQFINTTAGAYLQVYGLSESTPSYEVAAVFNAPLLARGAGGRILSVLRSLGAKMVSVNVTRGDWMKTVAAPVATLLVRVPKRDLRDVAVIYVPGSATQLRAEAPTVNGTIFLAGPDNPHVTVYYSANPSQFIVLHGTGPDPRYGALIWYWDSFLDPLGLKPERLAGAANLTAGHPEGFSLLAFSWSRAAGYSLTPLAGPANNSVAALSAIEALATSWGGVVVPLHSPTEVVSEDNETVTLRVALWTGGFAGGKVVVGKVLNASGLALVGWVRERDPSGLYVDGAVVAFYPERVAVEVYSTAPVVAGEVDATRPEGGVEVVSLGDLSYEVVKPPPPPSEPEPTHAHMMLGIMLGVLAALAASVVAFIKLASWLYGRLRGK
ncbi:MAG: hypothetical protein B7L53_07895 [Thermofilum sp. NZ13]|nr:MAG: hypothetical protein B7L53_07895 [Thermofilum sp. NZ13]